MTGRAPSDAASVAKRCRTDLDAQMRGEIRNKPRFLFSDLHAGKSWLTNDSRKRSKRTEEKRPLVGVVTQR